MTVMPVIFADELIVSLLACIAPLVVSGNPKYFFYACRALFFAGPRLPATSLRNGRTPRWRFSRPMGREWA